MSAEQGGGSPGSGAVSDRMRALLSRAAEEQLLEQRQVSSVLGELRALLEDVDDRLATGEQVERVAAEVRALSTQVDAQLDAAEARSAELAERIGAATAMLGQAAQDLAGAVAAQVAERVELQLREVLADVAETVASSERRLATHVDDAVLALAEVVFRRRHTAVPATPAAAPTAGPPDEDLPDGPPQSSPLEDPAAPVDGRGVERTDEPDRPTDSPPSDGYVLVPADVEEPDAAPAAPVQHERRTADRRTTERSDGSGRRRRPWWRPA